MEVVVRAEQPAQGLFVAHSRGVRISLLPVKSQLTDDQSRGFSKSFLFATSFFANPIDRFPSGWSCRDVWFDGGTLWSLMMIVETSGASAAVS